MPVRTIRRQLEAKLVARQRGGLFTKQPSGKLERTWYEDGTHRLKVSVRNVPVPDGQAVAIRVDQAPLASFPIQRGRGRVDEETTAPTPPLFLPLTAGQQVQVVHNGSILLQGELYVD